MVFVDQVILVPPSARYAWRDGLFDVTWSELHASVIVVAGGDGNVVVFDLNVADVSLQYQRRVRHVYLNYNL